MTEADYPYDFNNPENPCAYDTSKVVPNTDQMTNTIALTRGEDQFLAFIHHNGPINGGVNADVFL